MTKKIEYAYVLTGKKEMEERLEEGGIETGPLYMMRVHPKDKKKSLSSLLKAHAKKHKIKP